MTNSLIPPKDTYTDVFEKCISNLQKSTKQKFVDNQNYFVNAGNDFLNKIATKEIYLINQIKTVNKVITKDEMVYLYTGKLAKLGHPARDFYDRWRSIPAYGQCPLCGVRTVSTLDHYLPKADFPVFSIYPLNLIPACKDCNTDKLSEIAYSHNQETIHPYFDTLKDDYYLQAVIIETRPASLLFKIEAPASWNNDIKERLKNHFRVFQLNKLYVTLAAQELSNIRYRMAMLYSTGGEKSVKDFLLDQLETRDMANKNSWQTAMYRSMSKSKWFHNNGFLF